MHEPTPMCTHTHMYPHPHVHKPTCAHTYTHVHTPTHILVPANMYVHKNTHHTNIYMRNMREKVIVVTCKFVEVLVKKMENIPCLELGPM